MAAEASDDLDAPIVGINVTPLVDVVLVLLVVLMVTAPLLAAKALPLDLPTAATAGEQQTVLAIDLAADGRIAVDDRVLEGDAALLPLAEEARGKTPGLRAVIRADGAVPHRRVVRVMDLLRKASIAKIAFGTSDEELGEGPGEEEVGR